MIGQNEEEEDVGGLSPHLRCLDVKYVEAVVQGEHWTALQRHLL